MSDQTNPTTNDEKPEEATPAVTPEVPATEAQ